jgi:uncharacterized protein (TIGR02996 family)
VASRIVAPADPKQTELEAQIREHPDDDAGYLVYGDWLQAVGDPRGRLIAIQAARLAGDTPALAAAEAELLAAHRDELLGPDADLEPLARIEWHLGFWRSLGLGQVGASATPARDPEVTRLLTCASARFLRELQVQGSVTRDVFALIPRVEQTLRELDVSSGHHMIDDSDVARLRGCARLRRLALFSCKLVTPRGLAVLRELRGLAELDLRNCLLSDEGATQLAGLPLEIVKFNTVANLTATGMSVLAALPLTSLDLDADSIADPAITALAGHPTLTNLELGGAQIGPGGAAALGTLASLRRLYLPSSAITDAGVQRLPRGLRSLHLGHCAAVSDASCAHLARMQGLAFIDLSATQVTGAGIRALREVPSLLHADLSFLYLGDGDIAELAALPGLRSLSVAFSQRLTDTALDTIEALHALEQLDLASTAITADGIDRLARMPHLRELGVYNCRPETVARARSYEHWYVNARDTIDMFDR